jgi:hypothetical protein
MQKGPKPELPSVKSFIIVETLVLAILGILVFVIVSIIKAIAWVIRSIWRHFFPYNNSEYVDGTWWAISTNNQSPIPDNEYLDWDMAAQRYYRIPAEYRGTINQIYRYHATDKKRRNWTYYVVDPMGDGFKPLS